MVLGTNKFHASLPLIKNSGIKNYGVNLSCQYYMLRDL